MAEKEDLDIIQALVDANCRAYNEEFGYHYDSRCLEHYNNGIARLVEAGRIQGHGVSQRQGAGASTKYRSAKLKATTALNAETVPGQTQPRVRGTYAAEQVQRPTSDPLWQRWQEENARLREENASLKAQVNKGNGQPA